MSIISTECFGIPDILCNYLFILKITKDQSDELHAGKKKCRSAHAWQAGSEILIELCHRGRFQRWSKRIWSWDDETIDVFYRKQEWIYYDLWTCLLPKTKIKIQLTLKNDISSKSRRRKKSLDKVLNYFIDLLHPSYRPFWPFLMNSSMDSSSEIYDNVSTPSTKS